MRAPVCISGSAFTQKLLCVNPAANKEGERGKKGSEEREMERNRETQNETKRVWWMEREVELKTEREREK